MKQQMKILYATRHRSYYGMTEARRKLARGDHPADSRLQTRDSAKMSGDADRARDVCAQARWREAGSDSGGSASARSAWRPRQVVRVVGSAEDGVLGREV